MKRKMIVFGDIHLDWEAVNIILDEARNLSIDNALNLGDEDSVFVLSEPWMYDKIYGAMRDFRDEKPERELICCLGDNTGGVKPYLFENYTGFDSKGEKIGSIVLKKENVIAAHRGEKILEEYKKFIKEYKGLEPLIIFHGHSHSMGVLPEFKWLEQNEFIHFIPEEKREFKLEPSKVYWINPGARSPDIVGRKSYANFAIYDPEKQLITLRTKKFTRTEK